MKKANPFTPGKRLTRPDLFAGRDKQVHAGVALLAQAAAGNVRHGLITGERGIGKSSLASQLEGIAKGDPQYLDLIGHDPNEAPPFRFLVAEHVAQRGEHVPDITRKLLDELERAQNRARATWKLDVEFDFKLFKAKI